MSQITPRAIIVPAYNEEATLAATLHELAVHQPHALLVIVDNASTDATFEVAQRAVIEHRLQAVVLREPRKGKANALRAGMAAVDALSYAWIDADLTYPADTLETMFALVERGEADMVCGDRLSSGAYASENKRAFHNLGNALVTHLIGTMFGQGIADPMTGLRVMSRAVVDAYPMLPQGFEIEVDLTSFALDSRFRVVELPIAYRDRPAGSVSKLNTFRDGFRVVTRVLNLFRHYRPLQFYLWAASGVAAMSATLGAVPVIEFLRTGQILHLPTAILASGVGIIAFVLLVAGLVLDSVALRSRQQIEQSFAAVRRRQQPVTLPQGAPPRPRLVASS